MELKTNIEVSYNTGINTTTNGIVTGKIERYAFDSFTSIIVVYSYSVNDEEIKMDSFKISGQDIENLYTTVSGNLPDISLGFLTWNESLYYEAFRIEMSNTFGITPGDIDII